jgi:hypothetical protein
MSLKLVKNGMTHLAMFSSTGNVLQPSEALYKKNPIILRGRFRPVTHVNVDMLFAGLKMFKADPEVHKENIIVLTELTLGDLQGDGIIDEQDFLNRVDLLCSLGQNVMISNYTEYYRLVRHLTRINGDYKIGLILGLNNLQSVFEEKYYTEVRGGILEAFGILFGRNVKFYVYPTLKEGSSEVASLHNFVLPEAQQSLLKYLVMNDKLEAVENVEAHNLHIISNDVLDMIHSNKSGWEKMVPHKVATEIKAKGLFNYKTPQSMLPGKETT